MCAIAIALARPHPPPPISSAARSSLRPLPDGAELHDHPSQDALNCAEGESGGAHTRKDVVRRIQRLRAREQHHLMAIEMRSRAKTTN